MNRAKCTIQDLTPNFYKYTDPNGQNRLLARMAGVLKSPKLTGRQAVRAVKNTLEAIGLIATAVESSRSDPARDGRDPDVPMESDVPKEGGKEKKGQTSSPKGKCPDCGKKTTNKPKKIAQNHGLTVEEVQDVIHDLKGGRINNNPDVEVCSSCGEVFPQTPSGELGDSIGNIKDEI